MPISYHLKPDARLVILIHAGAVTDDEFLRFYKSLYEDNRFDKSFNLLIDLGQTSSSVRSAAALRELAQFMQKQFVNTTARPKIAVVAPKDVSFGMARMYNFFSRDMSYEFAVFRTTNAALTWLGLPENLLNDLDQDIQPGISPDFK
jgi:hypothetical protein